jgi:hypothetical protein
MNCEEAILACFNNSTPEIFFGEVSATTINLVRKTAKFKSSISRILVTCVTVQTNPFAVIDLTVGEWDIRLK